MAGSSAFRLLVTAMAVAAFLYILFMLIDSMTPKTDVLEEINSLLKKAEAEDGKAFGAEIDFRADFGLSAENLDKRYRHVIFECLNPLNCCPLKDPGKKAGCAMAMDERIMQSQGNQKLSVYSRCAKGDNLLVCRIYLGNSPAQLQLNELAAEQSYDLGKGTPLIEVGFENTGKIKARDVTIELKVYSKRLIEGEQREVLAMDALKKTVDELEGKQPEKIGFILDGLEGGDYYVKATVSADNAGYASQEKEFKATGGSALGNCRATIEGETKRTSEGCVRKYLCTGCEFDYQCSIAWQEKGLQEGAIINRFKDSIQAIVFDGYCD